MIADLLAVGQLALGEDGRDIVEFFDFLGFKAKDVARWNELFEREIFGIQHVKRVWLGNNALGYVVGGCRNIFDLDARIFEALLTDQIAFVHARAEVTQHFWLGRVDIGKARDGARTCGKACNTGGTFKQRATAHFGI